MFVVAALVCAIGGILLGFVLGDRRSHDAAYDRGRADTFDEELDAARRIWAAAEVRHLTDGTS